MSFSEDWAACMATKGMPVPSVETVNEALEVVHQIHTAVENSGGEAITIAELIGTGALAGLGEGALVVLAGVGQTLALVYINDAIACLAAAALSDLRQRFADNELPDFVVAELESQQVDLTGQGVG